MPCEVSSFTAYLLLVVAIMQAQLLRDNHSQADLNSARFPYHKVNHLPYK